MDSGEERSRIAEVRPRHQSYLYGLIDEGRGVSAGSFVPDDGGGLFLYEADSLREAERLVRDDPYVPEGLIAAWKLREYEVHGVNRDLLRVTGPRPSTSEPRDGHDDG